MDKIWLSSPHIGKKELYYVNQAFDTNWIAPLGPNVDGFETELGNYLGGKNVAALSSGTAAIHLALILSGVTQGDEVFCQSFTFSATANPIIYQGAIPVFVDSESSTWNMCPELLEVAIKDRIAKGKKPKACIVVHLYGMPAKIVEIKQICNRYNIILIEDAAEALGSTFSGIKLGTFGDFGVLSFNGNKIITTSGGGALISNSEDQITKAKFLATQARDEAPHYEHSHIGYNYRMSNICAGIGRGQLEVIEDRVMSRRANYEYYKKKLEVISDIKFIKEIEGFFSNRWLSCIVFNSYERREKTRIVLENNNIEARPLWKPMHLQPIFNIYPKYINNVSENLFLNGLCLPSGSNLLEEQLEKVVNLIIRTYH